MGWGPHPRGMQMTHWFNWHSIIVTLWIYPYNYDYSRLTTLHCIVSSLSAMAALDVLRWNFIRRSPFQPTCCELLILNLYHLWVQVVLDESGFSKGYGFVRCVQAIWTGHLTDVKNFCSGLGARRSSSTRLAAWLARWVSVASPSRSSPRNLNFHPCNFPWHT